MTLNTLINKPWLLGGVGTPLLPASWGFGRQWSAQLIGHNYAPLDRMMSSSQLSREAVVTAKNYRDIDFAATACACICYLKEADPKWLDDLVADSTMFESGLLGDLPLRKSTLLALAAMNFNLEAPISIIVRRKRREFGEHADGWVALLDLCVALECWWPLRHKSQIHVIQNSAHTLEDIAAALVSEYIDLDGNRLGAEWVGFILRRNSWGIAEATLDAIGKDANLTRERVRQIQMRLELSVGTRKWPLPGILAAALEEVRANNFRNVQQALTDSGLAADDDWTPEELVLLLTWFGYSELALALEERFQEVNKKYSDPRAVKAVRNARSKIGLIRLDSVAWDDGTILAESFVREITGQVYSRVYENAGWLLAGGESTTMLESGVGRQFRFMQPLDGEELFDGLVRIQKNRSLPALPSSEIVFNLLEQSGAVSVSDGEYVGPICESEPGSLNYWLAALLADSDGFVLHKETINRAAIRDKVNISSLGVHYLYSPVVRNCGDRRGLIRLVGRTPTAEQLDHAVQVAEVLRVPMNFDWSAFSEGISLSMTMSSNFVGTGVLSAAPVALTRMWPGKGASIACTCEQRFSGHISQYGKGSLIGWSPILHHLLLAHELNEGDRVSFELRHDELHLVSTLSK